MRRLLIGLFAVLGTIPIWCQEVVVFQDHRSLVVQSHRVQAEWTYLKIGSGEMAVLSSSVLEIRQEPSGATSSQPSPPPSFGGQPSPQPPPSSAGRHFSGGPRPGAGLPAFRGGMPPQPEAAQSPEAQAPGDEADDEEPDAEEPPERPPQPMVPQNTPQPLQPPNLIQKPGSVPLIAPGSGTSKDR